MEYTISNDMLDNVEQHTTPNTGKIFNPKLRRFLVAHYTAGTEISGTIAHFKKPGPGASSAHLVIGRDGHVAQLVPFSRMAWHAGVSAWKDSRGKSIASLNAYSIGIELVNAGWLRKSDGGNYFTWRGTKISNSDDIVEVDPKAPESFGKRYWHAYSEKQIEAFVDVASALIEKYALEDLLGHSDICPGRKTDPGPGFPLNNIRSLLFGRASA